MWNKSEEIDLNKRVYALTGAVNELNKTIRWQSSLIRQLQEKVLPSLKSVESIVRQVDENVYYGFAPKKNSVVKKKKNKR